MRKIILPHSLLYVRKVLKNNREKQKEREEKHKREFEELGRTMVKSAHNPYHISEERLKRALGKVKAVGIHAIIPPAVSTLSTAAMVAGGIPLPHAMAKGAGIGFATRTALAARELHKRSKKKTQENPPSEKSVPDDIQESIQFYIVSEGVQLSPAARTAIDNVKQAKAPGAITKTIKYFKKKGAAAVKPIRNRLRQSRVRRLERGEAPRFMNPYKRYNSSSSTIKAAKRAYRNSKLHAQIKAHKTRTRELVRAHNDRIRQINAKIKSAKGNAIKRAKLKGRKGVLIANHQTRLGKRDAVLKTKADNLLRKRRETTASGQIARSARKHQAGHVTAGPVAHFIPAREPLLLHPATAGLYPVAKGLEWMRVGAHLAHASTLGDVASKHDTRADRQLSRKKPRRPVLEKKPRRPRKLT